MADAKKDKEFSTYKGRPLVRCGDEIYYGNMEEPYVIRMQIKSKKEQNGIEIADKVAIQLMATDPYLSPRKQLVKSSEKKGLFLAMDIADIWLNRALAGKMLPPRAKPPLETFDLFLRFCNGGAEVRFDFNLITNVFATAGQKFDLTST